ncbi:MAG: hypothetical protein H6920_04695 [Sphingomonadaceae bacterium]|nr:hypothetical protein [Sphingomonadaceae bacterium]MCP5390910.1 hypothetical protein [Sphingomonadaceae bacterium]MCP5394666.1 hypothetical protein [Sphingomonadaceae bacterium]
MKLDLGSAWDDCVAMLRANFGLVAIMAGVFVAVPNSFFMLRFLRFATIFEDPRLAQKPEMVSSAFATFGAENWWLIALTMLGQTLGTLAIIILLSDRERPTTGGAIAEAAKLTLPAIAGMLLASFAMALGGMFPLIIGALSGSFVIVFLLGLIGFALACYLFAKFALIQAVFGIEKTMNPIYALTRSWKLVKGNTLLLFFFYFLLWVAFVIVNQVIALFVGLVFALFSAEAAIFGNALTSAAIGAAYAAIVAATMVAIYRQLSGESKNVLSETFE